MRLFGAFLPHSGCTSNFVITGFNTDIEYEGVVYHVQTEDKGIAKPIILSLVYDRGTILASKRSPYDDLLEGDLDEKVLAARLQRQHKLICAAIKAGRIEDIRRMGTKDAAVAETVGTAPAPTVGVYSGARPSLPLDFDTPIPKPVFEPLPRVTTKSLDELFIDDVSIVDDVILADELVSLFGGDIQSFDPNDPSEEKLNIELLDAEVFKGGDRRAISLAASRGKSRSVVSNAQIMVKILGSSFRPLIFHSSTNEHGVANVDIHLPNFSTGRAALLIRVMSNGEEVELRRAIEHG